MLPPEVNKKYSWLETKCVFHIFFPSGLPSWSLLVAIIGEKSVADNDIQTKTMTVINRTLANLSDMDSYYDIVDALEEQNMEKIMAVSFVVLWINFCYCSNPDCMGQLQLYRCYKHIHTYCIRLGNFRVRKFSSFDFLCVLFSPPGKSGEKKFNGV